MYIQIRGAQTPLICSQDTNLIYASLWTKDAKNLC